MIGEQTGKICIYDVRISGCRMCRKHQNAGTDVPMHDCCINWHGSSKGMEPDVGASLVKELESKGVYVDTIIMDDDATTMARIRANTNHEVNKISDKNHTCKRLKGSLYALQGKHSSLTGQVIDWFCKCFSYALSQTKNDCVAFKKRISQIVPHAFGYHKNCGVWCKAENDAYVHNGLKKNLVGEELQKDLKAIFQTFTNNSEKIAPCGSTKEVESFNYMVASKAPKRCHFSGSKNLLIRVACAVAQKNLGNTYLDEIYKEAGLSPCKVATRTGRKRDLEREKQIEYTNRRDVKRRKIDFKMKSFQITKGKEKNEGATYQAGIAATHHGELNSIPPPSVHPTCVPIDNVEGKNIVFCDIETSSLNDDADILQLAATRQNKSFNKFIAPTSGCSIDPKASKVHGLTARKGVLFKNGSPIPAVPLREALETFIHFLKDRHPVVLVGHKLKTFDFPRILKGCRRVNLEQEFLAVCEGGIDTLPAFQAVLKDEPCHKQESLVLSILGENYQAHDALEDVIALEKLWEKVDVGIDVSNQCSFKSSWASQALTHKLASSSNESTFQPLIDQDVIKKGIAKKMSKNGLSFIHLQESFHHGGATGLKGLLTEMVLGEDGKQVPRCTKTKRIHESIVNFFTNNIDKNKM